MKPTQKEGVSYNEDGLKIDLSKDLPDDFILTNLQRFNKKLSVRSGISAYIAYKFELNTPPGFDKIFKDNLIRTPDGITMIKKSVLAFNRLIPINSFDVILYPQSSSPINSVIAKLFEAKSASNTLNIPNSVIKNSLENIRIDYSKLETASDETLKKINQIVSSTTGKFELKKVPPSLRGLFSNFLKFNTDRDRELFNRINGGRILIIDDILTKGTTIKELNRLALERGAKEIVVFIFLQRKS